MADLGALRYDAAHYLNHEDEYAVAWHITGRFKAQDGVLYCFMISIAGTTRSGIKFFLWTHWLLGRLATEGYEDG